jgi:hypothetical protein
MQYALMTFDSFVLLYLCVILCEGVEERFHLKHEKGYICSLGGLCKGEAFKMQTNRRLPRQAIYFFY